MTETILPARKPPGETCISIVLPLYNEVRVLERLVQLVRQAVSRCGCEYEILFVNDGSSDGIKRFLFFAFYRVLNLVSRTPIPRDAGNFCLVDRRVAVQIAELHDRDRFFPGLRSWVGFRQIGIRVERLARHDGRPRVSLLGLIRLAKSAIFSFSALPLTVFCLISAVSLMIAAALTCFVLYHKLWTGLAIPGWASITLTGSLYGALNALGIGILGEYVVRIYDQVRAHPLFLVARRVNFEAESRDSVPRNPQLWEAPANAFSEVHSSREPHIHTEV